VNEISLTASDIFGWDVEPARRARSRRGPLSHVKLDCNFLLRRLSNVSSWCVEVMTSDNRIDLDTEKQEEGEKLRPELRHPHPFIPVTFPPSTVTRSQCVSTPRALGT
jgi:hypothetical protein